MNKNIQGIIFDWAGTTVDYGCFAPVVTFIEVFKKHGIELTLEEVIAPMGIHKKEHIKILLQLDRVKTLWNKKYNSLPTSKDVDTLYEMFKPMLISILKDFASPNPHVIETLSKLREKGLKIGSTTGYIRKMMDTLIPFAKENGYSPDNVVTSDEVPIGRPSPYMCYKNAIDLGIYPLETIIKVGDTIADIKEGVNASMWSVGIIMGSSLMGMTKDDVSTCDVKKLEKKMKKIETALYNAGAHFVIKDMSYLIPLIDKINVLLNEGITPYMYKPTI